MSNLSEIAMAIVARAKYDAATLADPQIIATLEAAARADASSIFAASHLPIGPDTYEIRSVINAGETTSAQESYTFDRPVEIVAFIASLIDLETPAKKVATLSDLAVELRVSSNALTNARGSGSSGGVAGSVSSQDTFVSLAAIDVRAPRVHRLALLGSAPRIDVRFQFPRGGAVYSGTRIALSMITRSL